MPSSAQQVKQNKLIVDLKAAGIWSGLDIFYLFANDGSGNFGLLNWVSPTSYQCTLVNSPSFTTNKGFLGNGSSSYILTNWTPSTNGVNHTLNDHSIFAKQENESAADNSDCLWGSSDGTNRSLLRSKVVAGMRQMTSASVSLINAGTVSSTIGFQLVRRISSSSYGIFTDGVAGTTSTGTATALPNVPLTFLALNTSNVFSAFLPGQISIGGAGASLNSKEATLNTLITNYITSL